MGLSKHCWSTLMPRERAASFGAFLQGFGIRLGGHADFVQVGIEAHAIPACGLQILTRANEGAGAIVHSLAQGAEVAAGFGHEEDQRLLRLLGNGDKDAFVRGPGASRCRPG